jgi:hypothetical protein
LGGTSFANIEIRAVQEESLYGSDYSFSFVDESCDGGEQRRPA